MYNNFSVHTNKFRKNGSGSDIVLLFFLPVLTLMTKTIIPHMQTHICNITVISVEKIYIFGQYVNQNLAYKSMAFNLFWSEKKYFYVIFSKPWIRFLAAGLFL